MTRGIADTLNEAKLRALLVDLGRAATRFRFEVAPNPCVGAAILAEGEVIARGFHEVWGEAHADNVVWGEACGGRNCNVVWGEAHADNVVWGETNADNVVWGERVADNVVWGERIADNVVWGERIGDNVVWGESLRQHQVIWPAGEPKRPGQR